MINKDNSRTKNTFLNFTSSLIGQILTIIVQFAVQTVFIKTLGKSYLGIGSLFSNILQMLSLVELGVGSAIIYKLYEPVAHNNYDRINALMHFYRIVYHLIGLVIGIIGVCCIPFLPTLIKDYNSLKSLGLNATFIYLLYLFQSVSSYLFLAYRTAIIRANQKEYVITVIGYVFTILQGIAQIIALLVFRNFTLYVVLIISKVIFENIFCGIAAGRLYPYILKPTEKKLNRYEIISIFKDCGALLLYKINAVVVKATDNIVLSVFKGLETVALYSNYYIFFTTIKAFFCRVFNAVAHSLGNLHTTHNVDHEYDVFETIMLVAAIIGGTAAIGIFVCADDFILAWVGKDWILEQPFSLLMGFELFTGAFKEALSKYRTTMGLFQEAKLRPVLGIIVNIIVSVALVNKFGICGVLVGTIVSDWTTFMWFDPIIIHKHGFKKSEYISRFYKKLLKYLLTILVVGFLDYCLCAKIFTGMGWWTVILHGMVCIATVPFAFLAVSFRTNEGKNMCSLVKHLISGFGLKKRTK